MALRKDLEQHFRPVFQQFVYGGERIALHDLRRLLENGMYRQLLPPDKVHDLLDLADFNPGKAISYDEFIYIVIGDREPNVLEGRSSVGNISRASQKKRERSEGFLYNVCRNTIPSIELGEYMFKYRCCPPPIFMIAISITQIIFMVVVANNAGVSTTALEGFDINSTLMYKPTRRYEAWRFLTYIFNHQGFMHLIFTLLFQLCFGIPLEMVFSFWRLLIVYIFGVLTGSLLQSVSDHYVGLVGGSSGIYAIMTAHFVSFIYNWKELNKKAKDGPCTRFFCNLPLRIIIILIIAGADIGTAFYRRFGLSSPHQIGLGGHAGGILAGIVLSKSFMRDVKRYPWQQNSGWISLFTFLALLGGGVVFNVAYKGYPPTDWS